MTSPWRNLPALGAIAVVGAIAVALAPTAAEGSFPGANGVIAYSAEHSIWAVDPATGDQLRLTTGPEDSAPSFSPSGDMLAFQRRTTITVNAFQRHPASTAATPRRHPTSTAATPRSPPASTLTTPRRPPTSTATALRHRTPIATSTVTIYIANADGSNPTPLVGGSEPAFSPDGRQIVFVAPAGLFLTDVTPGSPVRKLTDHPGDRTPRWSSKGSIVFQRTDGKDSDLDIVAPPSSHVRRLLTYRNGFGEESPTPMWPEWSPNGASISVALCAPGSEPPPLETVPSVVFHSSCAPDVWAPVGERLVEAGAGVLKGHTETTCPPFIEGGGSEYESFSRNGRPLYRDEGPSWPIAWQPLHRGTLRVSTMPCTKDRARENAATSIAIPQILRPHGLVCVYFRLRHRKICHRT